MIDVLVAALSLGVDGFVACAAIGLVGGVIGRPLPFVAWFGVCDGLGLLAGHAMHLSPVWGAVSEPAMAALWTMLALLLIVSRSRPLLFLLPVLLAFDNFLAGAAGTQPVLLLDVVLTCLTSAMLAAAGLVIGCGARTALLARLERRPGGSIG